MPPEEPRLQEDCPASSSERGPEAPGAVNQTQTTEHQATSQNPSSQNAGMHVAEGPGLETQGHVNVQCSDSTLLTEYLPSSRQVSAQATLEVSQAKHEEDNSCCSSTLPQTISYSENTAGNTIIRGENDSSHSAEKEMSPISSHSSFTNQEVRVAAKIKSNISHVGRASIRSAKTMVKQQSKLMSGKTKALRSMSTRSLAGLGLTSMTSQASRGSDRNSRRNATMDLNFDDVVKAHRGMLMDQARLGAFCMLMPGSRVITLWTSVMILVVLIAVCTAPVELGFQWWNTPVWWQVMVKVVDFFCMNDMLMTFNLAYFTHGRLVTSRRKIGLRYLKTWFVCDALSNIPWDWFLSGKSAKGRKMVKLLKLPKVFRVARLLRMVREQAHYVGTALILVGMVILAHYCSCLWAFVLIDCDPDDPDALKAGNRKAACPSILHAYLEGLSVGMATLGGSDAWLRFHHALIVTDGQTSAFSWTTPPGVTTELMSIASCIIGLCTLALLFGSISQAFRKVCENNRLFHDRLANLHAASGQHTVQKEIHMRARRHYHYIWNCGSDATRAILNDRALSVDLRRQLAFCFYGEYLKRVPFLASGEEGFLMQLSERVEVEYFSPQDALIRAGERGDELYFLAVGEVEVFQPGCSTAIKRLEEGSFFGELGLLFPEMKRNASIIASTSGCVLTVKREAFQEICSDAMLEIFRSIAKDRNNHEKSDKSPCESTNGAELQAGGGGERGATLSRQTTNEFQSSVKLQGVPLRSDVRADTLPGRLQQEDNNFAMPDAEEIFCRMCQQLEQTMLEWRQPFQRQINELNAKITLLEPMLERVRHLDKSPQEKQTWWSPASSKASNGSAHRAPEGLAESGCGRQKRSRSHDIPARTWSGRVRRVQSVS